MELRRDLGLGGGARGTALVWDELSSMKLRAGARPRGAAGLEFLREPLQAFDVSRGQWLLCPRVARMERQGSVVGREPGSGVTPAG